MQETQITDLSTTVHMTWPGKCPQGVLCQKFLPNLADGEVFLELRLKGCKEMGQVLEEGGVGKKEGFSRQRNLKKAEW